ncbi:MAG: hypothetical protein VXV96_18170 [Bdellovibrionota bacterium]|nr:hypothetical protein [Bdellovibrionota bacterium]
MDYKEQLVRDVDALCESVGEFIRYWGFKKIHGKIWCHLFLSTQPLDATELIERTEVSKACMSQSLAELLDYQVIEVLDDSKKKKQYIPNRNILTVITGVLRKREQNILCSIHSQFRAVENFNEEQLELVGVDKKRLEKLGGMIKFAEKLLCSVLRFESISFKAFKKIFE